MYVYVHTRRHPCTHVTIIVTEGAGEMDGGVELWLLLQRTPSSAPSSHMAAHTILTPDSRGFVYLLLSGLLKHQQYRRDRHTSG